MPGSRDHGILWSRRGPLIDLGASFEPVDINDRGPIAGTFFPPTGGPHPAIVERGRLHDLGLSPRAVHGFAAAINRFGHVTATMTIPSTNQPYVALWRPRGGWTEIEPDRPNDAVDVDDADDLLAMNLSDEHFPRGTLLLHEGGSIDLGTLGGPSAVTFPAAMNDSTVAVGRSEAADSSNFPVSPLVAFRWTRESGMVALPPLNVGLTSARDINDLGEIVGQAQGHAVIWTQRRWPGPAATTNPLDATWREARHRPRARRGA